MTGAGSGGSLQHPQGERDQPRERGSGEAGRGHDTLLPGHVWTVDSSYMCLDICRNATISYLRAKD